MSSGLVEGAVFAGRYRIVRCIAAGGMGAVYEVVHLETQRRRALKVMLPHVLESEELRERFQLEARVAASIESEFIVDVFDAGFDEATEMPFLVMELLRGEELSKRLKRLGRLGPEELMAVLHQISLALDKTHRASIVHRDLKPANIFLTEREDGPPRVKLLDFGVAKVLAESVSAGATQSIGTPLYMAPEQFNPCVRLSGAADLYALAMVTYTLLVGNAYWGEESRGGNVFALASVAMHGPREPASARAARRGVTLSPGFDAWFAQATAFDPAQRFASAAAMVAALAWALGVRAPQPSLSGAGALGGDSQAPGPISQAGGDPRTPGPLGYAGGDPHTPGPAGYAGGDPQIPSAPRLPVAVGGSAPPPAASSLAVEPVTGGATAATSAVVSRRGSVAAVLGIGAATVAVLGLGAALALRGSGASSRGDTSLPSARPAAMATIVATAVAADPRPSPIPAETASAAPEVQAGGAADAAVASADSAARPPDPRPTAHVAAVKAPAIAVKAPPATTVDPALPVKKRYSRD